jgi:hypothetical protein
MKTMHTRYEVHLRGALDDGLGRFWRSTTWETCVHTSCFRVSKSPRRRCGRSSTGRRHWVYPSSASAPRRSPEQDRDR